MKPFSNKTGRIYRTQSDYDCFVLASLFSITVNSDDELASLTSRQSVASLFVDYVCENIGAN